MKVITGDKFITSCGIMVVQNEQDQAFAVGDAVRFDEGIYTVKEVIPPTTPAGKWSLKIA